MEIWLRCHRTLDFLHIVEGLTRSLLLRRMLKDLSLMSQDFPTVTVNAIDKAKLIVTEHGQALDKLIR